MNRDCPTMRSAAVSLTRETSSRSRTPGPESGESAPEDHQQQQQQQPMQVSAQAEIPQCVGGNVAVDDCHESSLDNTLTPECKSDASPCKKSFAESQGACNSVTVGSPKNANLNQQSVKTSQGSQDSKTSSEVPTSDTSQNAHHQTASADSERRFIREVRKIKSMMTATMTMITTTTTTSSSSSSSLNGGADFVGGHSRFDSESGADGNRDDTDTTRSSTSSIDVLDLYDYSLERIEEEKEKEKSFMGEISSWMVMVSSLSDDMRSYFLQVLGTLKLTPQTSRKLSRHRKKRKRSVVQEEVTGGPNGDFERRLKAVKAYLDDGSDEPEAIPEAKTEMEEEDSTVTVPEEVASCSTSSNAKQASGSSCSGEVVGCSGDMAPAVINRKEQRKGRVTEFLRKESYDEIIRKRHAARKSWDNHMVLKICDNAEQRILKGKFTCRAMLSCMKSVANVVNLTKDAYRATELAMQKARTCRSAPAGDILQAVATAAAETSDWMWKALRHAEAVVSIHAAIVEDIERTERSLFAVHSDNTFDDNVMSDATAALEHLKMLIPRTRVFGSYVPQCDEKAPWSTYDTPRPIIDLRSGASRGFQSVPADVIQNVLAAAMSYVEAVGATMRALKFFSTCEWCTGKKLRKRRGCAKKIVKDKH